MLSTRQRLIVLIVLIATPCTTRIIPKECLTQFEGKIIAGSGVQKKRQWGIMMICIPLIVNRRQSFKKNASVNHFFFPDLHSFQNRTLNHQIANLTNNLLLNAEPWMTSKKVLLNFSFTSRRYSSNKMQNKAVS